jgi:drug/metabolite transporter (DMT)-like permease
MLTLPPLLWAGNAIVGRMMVGSVPPVALNTLRWTLAFVLLLPLAWRVLARPTELLARWRYFALLGFLGMGCYNALQYAALRSSGPLNVTLIAASLPVWMLAVGALGFRERPTRRQAIGALLSLLGVAFVIARGEPAALLKVHFVLGDLLMLLAVFCWAIYSWMLVRPPAHMLGRARPNWNWAETLMAQTAFGLVAAGLMTAGEQLVLNSIGQEPINWGPGLALTLVYVAIGPSLIAYRCWGLGVAEAGPAMAAFFGNLTPVFAALMAAALLGEWPRWFHGVAFALIAAGILISARRRP